MTARQIASKVKNFNSKNKAGFTVKTNKSLVIIENCLMNSASQVIESLTGIKTISISQSIAKVL